MVTCISSFNFLFFLLLSIFSRGLLDVEGCDNAALCCLREDEDAAGCRSESVTCLPAIQYIHIKNMLYIFFDLLNPKKNKIFYIILVVKQLPSWSFETVSPSWLNFEGGRTKLSSSMSLSFSSLAETSSLSGQYSDI